MYAAPVQVLIDELGRLPGVGPKSAQRIAFHLLKLPPEDAARLARAITEAKARVGFCRRCFNVAEGDECGICLDARRDTSVVCVVEEPRDVVAVEKTQEFRGRYHVLLGAISPMASRPRVMWPATPSEATAMYLARLLKPLGVKATRIASGLPVGGDLEYADELTLGRALEGRRELDG